MQQRQVHLRSPAGLPKTERSGCGRALRRAEAAVGSVPGSAVAAGIFKTESRQYQIPELSRKAVAHATAIQLQPRHS